MLDSSRFARAKSDHTVLSLFNESQEVGEPDDYIYKLADGIREVHKDEFPPCMRSQEGLFLNNFDQKSKRQGLLQVNF